jgi:hypothetical protein
MVEDKVTAMHARHAIAKTPLDISELVVSCNKGVIDLTGKVKRPRNCASTQGMDVRKELQILAELIRASRGVKDVISNRVEIIE